MSFYHLLYFIKLNITDSCMNGISYHKWGISFYLIWKRSRFYCYLLFITRKD